MLVRHFVKIHGRRMNKQIQTIPAAAMEALTRYQWPGNVRELENIIERAVIVSRKTELEISLDGLNGHTEATAQKTGTLEAAEREYIVQALQESNWLVGGPSGAAARLGMKRTTLQYRMKKLGISVPK